MNHQKSVGRLISCIHRYGKITISNKLESYHLGSGQFHFLMALYQKDGIHQEHLAEILRIDKGTCARAIKRLEEEGYIRRVIDSKDKRAYQIFLTEKAQQMRPVIRRILREWTRTLLTGFSEEEKTLVFTFLEQIAENATAEKEHETR
jgi:DNA-binding MarR family transcriptional regulator